MARKSNVANLKPQTEETEETGSRKVARVMRRTAITCMIVWSVVSALGMYVLLHDGQRAEAITWSITNTAQTLQGKALYQEQSAHWLDLKAQAGN